MNEPPNRRPSITDEVSGEGFSLAVTVGFDPHFGNPCEVFMTKRGKSGTELEATLYELGVLASKIMQENDTSAQTIQGLKKEVKSLKQALKALSD
jgi:sulfopyruvate decarboxylase TPP-binding subunit|tara:strand:+ start:574 stop:858 length:285 start_codon:yes stop_codon:yes gene_type:complete